MNILYTTPGCPKCKLAKMKLDEAGFIYTVSEDIDAALEQGIRSAPTLVFDGKQYTFPEIIRLAKEGAAGV